MTSQKTSVSEQAVLQRIRRKLAREYMTVRTNRSDRWRSDLGNWYVVDLRTNFVRSAHTDLNQLGEAYGVLQPWERVADDDIVERIAQQIEERHADEESNAYDFVINDAKN